MLSGFSKRSQRFLFVFRQSVFFSFSPVGNKKERSQKTEKQKHGPENGPGNSQENGEENALESAALGSRTPRAILAFCRRHVPNYVGLLGSQLKPETDPQWKQKTVLETVKNTV